MSMKPGVKAFFDEETNTVTYVVADPSGNVCAVIDPVLDFDQASGRTSTDSADQVLNFIHGNGLELAWILETHAHADHLSAAAYLKSKSAGKTATGKLITDVQATFKGVFNLGGEFTPDGKQFDCLLEDGDRLELGAMEILVMHTPGHTPSCVTFVVGDAAFVGDTLFMPDYGTARADFPGGDAAVLYQSIQRIFALPPQTRIFLCHDYKAPGRDEYIILIQRITQVNIICIRVYKVVIFHIFITPENLKEIHTIISMPPRNHRDVDRSIRAAGKK